MSHFLVPLTWNLFRCLDSILTSSSARGSTPFISLIACNFRVIAHPRVLEWQHQSNSNDIDMLNDDEWDILDDL